MVVFFYQNYISDKRKLQVLVFIFLQHDLFFSYQLLNFSKCVAQVHLCTLDRNVSGPLLPRGQESQICPKTHQRANIPVENCYYVV